MRPNRFAAFKKEILCVGFPHSFFVFKLLAIYRLWNFTNFTFCIYISLSWKSQNKNCRIDGFYKNYLNMIRRRLNGGSQSPPKKIRSDASCRFRALLFVQNKRLFRAEIRASSAAYTLFDIDGRSGKSRLSQRSHRADSYRRASVILRAFFFYHFKIFFHLQPSFLTDAVG